MASENPNPMHGRTERVELQTERYRIVGDLLIRDARWRQRLSDFLNSSERDFISLTNVRLQPLRDSDRPVASHDFLTVARQHIVLATSAG
jgi:hypothetical protein